MILEQHTFPKKQHTFPKNRWFSFPFYFSTFLPQFSPSAEYETWQCMGLPSLWKQTWWALNSLTTQFFSKPLFSKLWCYSKMFLFALLWFYVMYMHANHTFLPESHRINIVVSTVIIVVSTWTLWLFTSPHNQPYLRNNQSIYSLHSIRQLILFWQISSINSTNLELIK